MVWNNHSQSWLFSLSRDSILAMSSARVGPPPCSACDGRFHLHGVVVDTLAAAASISGFLSYGAVWSHQARGGIGDPVNERYGAHRGMAPLVCGCPLSSNPTLEVHPLKQQEQLAKSYQVSTSTWPYSPDMGRSHRKIRKKRRIS